jgi:hypothetical protein
MHRIRRRRGHPGPRAQDVTRDARDIVPATGELLVYVGDDGAVHVQARLAEGTVRHG